MTSLDCLLGLNCRFTSLLPHSSFSATSLHKIKRKYFLCCIWSFWDGISDEFVCRDKCIHLSVCTWHLHATDDVRGFLSYALNTKEVSTRTCSLRQCWGVEGVDAYRNTQLRDSVQHEKPMSSIRGLRWNGEQRSTCVGFFPAIYYTEGNQHP